jgi:KAP family P-loop domain
MSTANPNDGTLQFLEYFRTLSQAPRYAVLLDGPWGSGKSHLVERFRQTLTSAHERVLCVSINGLATAAAIDEAVLQQMHPVWHSDGARMLRSVGRQLMKATLKVELAKVDADLTVDPSGNTSKWRSALTIPSGSMLILDDVERCAVPRRELFGYFARLVDDSDLKLVLIANELELIRQSDTPDTFEYSVSKDKVVGVTLTIRQDPEAAIASFIASLGEHPAGRVLAPDISILGEIALAAGYHNLRVARYGILEFARLYAQLPADVQENLALTRALARVYFVLILEVRGGHVAAEEIKFLGGIFAAVLRSTENPAGRKGQLLSLGRKYSSLSVDLDFMLLPDTLWAAMLAGAGLVNTEIVAALKNSAYFKDEHQPAWVRLWHFHRLDETTFRSVLAEVLAEIKGGRIQIVEEYLHIVGILLTLSTAKLLDESHDQIIVDAERYLTRMRSAGFLVRARQPTHTDIDTTAYAGLGYMANETPEFATAVSIFRSELEKAFLDSLPRHAEDLLAAAQSDHAIFRTRLLARHGSDSWFYATPILNQIPPESFVRVLVELDPDSARDVAGVLKSRFKERGFSRELVEELPWLESVGKLLDAEAAQHEKALRGYQLAKLVEWYIAPGIASLSGAQT